MSSVSNFVRSSSKEWNDALLPLYKKYQNRKHPLEYRNEYQLLVMVILSARSTDVMVNSIAPSLFEAYPNFPGLAKAKSDKIYPYVRSIRNYRHKVDWLQAAAAQIGSTNKIPHTMKELLELPGVGRKSANVIMRESGAQMEGIIVDLHTHRVANRLGIAKGKNPIAIEKEMMAKVDRKNWGVVGMSLSFLGRELCRPTNPKCIECPMVNVCAFHASGKTH